MSARLPCVLLACALALAGPARGASTTLVDYSDLWWNPAEAGWGAHVTLQGEAVFLVLYVHDATRAPRYFVASGMRIAPSLVPGETIFSGVLYRSTGSPFAAPHDAARVSAQAVGSATLRFTSPTDGILTYDVDGATVSKPISRNLLSRGSLAGDYLGGLFASSAGCASGAAGVGTIAYPGSIRVDQEGDEITLRMAFTPNFADSGSCVMRGRYVQAGRLGAITQGAYECEYIVGPLPHAGTFEMSNIEFTERGFFGDYVGRESPACIQQGRLGGVRSMPTPPPAPAEPE